MQGIYQIRNIKNNKVYVGSSKDIEKRFKQHKKMLEKGNHHSITLQRTYNHYKSLDIFEFSIIELIDKEEILRDREQYYIDSLEAYTKGYNCSEKVDNIKYTKKNQKKTNDKKRMLEYYREFKELYDKHSDRITIGHGKVFIRRLMEKHYKFSIYRNVNECIKWFIDNYNNDYTAHINCNGRMWLDVYDKNDNRFVYYTYNGKKMMISKDDTNMCINWLKHEGLWDDNIHIIKELDYL